MRKFSVLLSVLLFVSCLHAQPDNGPGMAQGAPPNDDDLDTLALGEVLNRLNNPGGKLNLSTPESTVRAFVSAFQMSDLKSARQCVQDAQPYEKLQAYEAALKKAVGDLNFLISDLRTYPHRDDRATVTFSSFDVAFRYLDEGFFSERMRLVKDNKSWLIVAPKQLPADDPDWHLEDFFAYQAATLVFPEALAKTSEIRQHSACQSNLKQIGLGILQFAQDFDEILSLNAEWQKQISPYVKANHIFSCPSSAEDEASYVFNVALKNQPLAAITKPTQTIMFYEGKDQKFDFRHQVGDENLTNILFADGHVKAFSAQSLEQEMKAATIRWKP